MHERALMADLMRKIEEVTRLGGATRVVRRDDHVDIAARHALDQPQAVKAFGPGGDAAPDDFQLTLGGEAGIPMGIGGGAEFGVGGEGQTVSSAGSAEGATKATLSAWPKETDMLGTWGATTGRSRTTFSMRLLATSVSRRMRVNSMRLA